MLRQMIKDNADVCLAVTSLVSNMDVLFYGASSFNQDISSWDVKEVKTCTSFGNKLPDEFLPNFENCNPQNLN